MKYVYLALNWIFGSIFLLGGIATAATTSFLAGLCLVLISLFFLPPVTKFAYLKTNKTLESKTKGFLMFLLVIAFSVFLTQSQKQEAEEMAANKVKAEAAEMAELRQKNIDYFNKNTAKILSDVKAALDNKNYKKVKSLSSKYIAANNKELSDLRKKANLELASIKAKKETKRILKKLKSTSASSYEENRGLYQKLVYYNPNVKKYKKKLAYYTDKIKAAEKKKRIKKAKEEKARKARIVKFGEAPVRSAWDGSYRAVEKYLKKIANDPDSIEIDDCTGVYHIKSGWLVGCDYRGKNGFGGMVRQSNWFTIVHGRVVQQHKASAYKR